jgi:hypothetical protein
VRKIKEKIELQWLYDINIYHGHKSVLYLSKTMYIYNTQKYKEQIYLSITGLTPIQPR